MNIAVLLPICSRNMKYLDLKKTHIIQNFIPSFIKYLDQKHKYTIFIGIDNTDFFFVKKKNQMSNILKTYNQIFNYEIIILKKCEHNPVKAWNTLFENVINKNNIFDYYYQANDDVIFKTPWINTFIETLQKNNNIGVVGGVELQNYNWRIKKKFKPIIENAFVHKTHYIIFKTFYNKNIINWDCDTWITEVYPDKYSTIIPSILHENSIRDKRYKISNIKQILPKLINNGKQLFKKFILDTVENIIMTQKFGWTNINKKSRNSIQINKYFEIFYIGMAKTGSKSLIHGLKEYNVIQIHNLCAFENVYKISLLSDNGLDLYDLILYIGEKHKFKPLIIECIREPISRSISNCIHIISKIKPDHGCEKNIYKRSLNWHNKIESIKMWNKHFNIDITKIFIPHNKFLYKELPNVKLLFIRYEEITDRQDVLKKLGYNYTVLHKNKGLYKKNMLTYSKKELDNIYSQKYVKTFYSNNEIYNFKKKFLCHHVAVITIGRSGSSQLINILEKTNLTVIPKPFNHLYPKDLKQKYGENIKVIFVTRNVTDIIYSLKKIEKYVGTPKEIKYGNSGISWIQKHYKNLNADFSQHHNINYQDTLSLEKLYDAYYENNFFDVLFIKYEQLYFNSKQTINQINNFLNIKLNYSDFKYNNSNNFKVHSNVDNIYDKNKKIIENTYKSLQNKLDNSNTPFIKKK